MRKKTTWAATVVRKQLQTCCQHETLSLETGEGDDDFSDILEVPSDVYVATPVKERAIPCLLRRKSFNVSHVRNLLTTPESQSPHRKSVESALPLCVGSKFKPRSCNMSRVRQLLWLLSWPYRCHFQCLRGWVKLPRLRCTINPGHCP